VKVLPYLAQDIMVIFQGLLIDLGRILSNTLLCEEEYQIMELEALKILMDASKSLKTIYLNNFWTTMGAYLIAAGWLLTSKEARSFLKNTRKSSATFKMGSHWNIFSTCRCAI
jgi:hypothetical protein